MKILVTGSSGLIGSALTHFLTERKHEVWKLVRGSAIKESHTIAWNPFAETQNLNDFEGFDAVVHLAGESLMGRWSKEKMEKIEKSRTQGTRALCKILSQLQTPPKVLISGSAIGFYGSRGDEVLTENATHGEGFLSQVCQKWEKATQIATKKGIRTVLLRTGIVLSGNGGALKQMLLPFKLWMGARLGDGKQYMSWIDLDDLVRIIYFCLKHPIEGPVNGVSPYPITNEEFTNTLASTLNRKAFFAAPKAVIECIFGEMGKEMLLSSTRVRPEKLLNEGFHFDYPRLGQSLESKINFSPTIKSRV